MIDVIRVKLINKVARFPMFNTKDHLSFLLTSADMHGKGIIEQQKILDEVLDILYPGYSKTEQEYIFINVYMSSFGKNAVKVARENKGHREEMFMVIQPHELCNEYRLDENNVLGFKFPHTREVNEELFLKCIDYLMHDGIRYEWSALEEDSKNDVLDLVGISEVEDIVTMLTSSMNVDIRGDKIPSFMALFKILFAKNDINDFCKTNFLMNKSNISFEFIMNATPVERSIYSTLLAEDMKENK